MAKAVRSVRKYNASELKKWMQLPRDVVRRTSMKDPRGELPIPFDHIRIIAMHHMLDRRNQPDCVWLDRHVFIHARLAGGVPAVSPGDVPVDTLVERFKKGESRRSRTVLALRRRKPHQPTRRGRRRRSRKRLRRKPRRCTASRSSKL